MVVSTESMKKEELDKGNQGPNAIFPKILPWISQEGEIQKRKIELGEIQSLTTPQIMLIKRIGKRI